MGTRNAAGVFVSQASPIRMPEMTRSRLRPPL